MGFVTEEEKANELADKSKNFLKGSHSLNIATAEGVRQFVKGETNALTDEEKTASEEKGNISYPKDMGRPKKGWSGGLSAESFEVFENADPELLNVRDIEPELSEHNRLLGEGKENERKVCNIIPKRGFKDDAPEDLKEFYRAWTQRDNREIQKLTVYESIHEGVDGIAITYVRNGVAQSTSFSTSELIKWFGNVDAFTNKGRTIGALFKFDDGETVALRPGNKKEKNSWLLRSIRLDGVGLPKFASIEVKDEGKYRHEIDKGTIFAQERRKTAKKTEAILNPNDFNVAIYQPGLDKYTKGVSGIGKEESETNRRNFELFWKIWTKSSKDINKVSFDISDNKKRIDSVTIYTKDGGRVTVPAWLLRVSTNITKSVDSEDGDYEGLRFISKNGNEIGHINPFTTSEEAKDVVSKMTLSGVKLSDSVEVAVK